MDENETSVYRYKYAVPGGRNKYLGSLYTDEKSDYILRDGWTLRGNKVYTDSPDIWALVQRTDLSVSIYPDQFVSALVYALAADMSLNLTEDIDTVQRMRNAAAEFLSKAVSDDAQSIPTQYLDTSFITRARATGYGGTGPVGGYF